MNSHDTNPHADPLSPEERALGERLARLGPHGEPSPALDARILAAAHAAATATTYAQARRPSRHWPVALGIAASLTLAIGIAWQLRPVQETATYDEAASATAGQAEVGAPPQESAAEIIAAEQVRAVAVQPPPSVDAGTAQAPASGSRRESDKAIPAPRPTAPAKRARALAPAPPAPAEPEAVFDASTPADASIPAPAAPPPAAAMRAPSPAPAAKAISGETRTQAAERNSADAAASSAAGTATQSREAAIAEDVPPATADSPEVREAWLQRIRELANDGNTDDARASLHEFVRRYPNHPLPDDLRALLQ